MLALLVACSPMDPDRMEDSAARDAGRSWRPHPAPDDVRPRRASYTVEAARRSLVADGRDETSLSVRGSPGAPAPVLRVDHGTLVGPRRVGSDAWSWTYRAGTWPSKASLRADDGVLTGETELVLSRPPAHATQLHLHGSLSEGNGRMTTFIASAESLGIDVLWWTDHDVFYYDDHFLELQAVDFEEGGLTQQIEGFPADTRIDVTWVELENTLTDGTAAVVVDAAATGGYGLRLSGTARDTTEWSVLRMRVRVLPTVNYKSLLADVRLGWSMRPRLGPDAEALVVVPMSWTPVSDNDAFPERSVRFYASAEDHTAETTAEVAWIRVPSDHDAWTSHAYDLTTLAARQWPLLDGDLHGEFLTVELRARNGAHAEVDLDDLVWTQTLTGTALRERQGEWIARRGSPVTGHVGLELSELVEGHFNAYGAAVPFLPYADTPELDAGAAVELVHAAGGLVAYNHMFGVLAEPPDAETRALEVAERIDLLLSNDAWGVDMLEVGYRQRHAELEDFVEVWDALGIAGRPITGIGTSDQHDDYALDRADNNFVTWVGAADGSEEALLAALARGNAWFGDPSSFPDAHVDASLDVPAHAASMGQVVVGAAAPAEVVFRAQPLVPGWEIRFVEDGVVTASARVDRRAAEARHTVDPSGGRLVRVEVLDAAGTPVLYTNPVAFADTADGVPGARLPQP